MTPAHESGGMVTPLAHGACVGNAHRPEEPGLGAVGSRHEAPRVIKAASSARGQRQAAQPVVGQQGVMIRTLASRDSTGARAGA